MTALDKLIEAVEAGKDTMNHHAAAFPSESAYGLCTWHRTHKAAGGSLDAALALHDALLPGWHPLIGRNIHHHYWHANVQRVGDDGIILCEGSTDQKSGGRALLLAILRAYRSVQA